MFSFLTTKPLLIVCAALVASTLSFAYLSYTFYGDKQVVEDQLKVALKSNKSIQESLEKQQQACVIDMQSTLEFQEDQKELEKNKEEVIKRIDKLASEVEKQEQVENEESVVNLDDELPGSLRSLLDSTFDSIQRKPTPNP